MKLSLPLTLLLLSASCVGRSTPVNPPAQVCKVAPWPEDPTLQIITEDCPVGRVCLTISSAVAIGYWARDLSRVKETLDGCPYIEWESP